MHVSVSRVIFFILAREKLLNYDVFFREGSLKIRYVSIWGGEGSKKAKKILMSFMDGPNYWLWAPGSLHHTVSFEVFGSLSKYEFATFYFYKNLWNCNAHLFANFFVKSQSSFTTVHHLTYFFWFHESSNEFVHLLKQCLEVYLELYFLF